jgi:hypothetical protein
MIGPEAISEHYYFENGHNTLRSVKLSDIIDPAPIVLAHAA